MIPPRFRPTRAVLVSVLLLLSACSGASNTTSQGPPEETTKSDGGEIVDASIVDTAFKPKELEIHAGASVRWTQAGVQPHSVTSANGDFDSSPDCGAIASDDCLGEGDEFVHRFEEPGTYLYYCRVHGLPDGTGMVARITVK